VKSIWYSPFHIICPIKLFISFQQHISLPPHKEKQKSKGTGLSTLINPVLVLPLFKIDFILTIPFEEATLSFMEINFNVRAFGFF